MATYLADRVVVFDGQPSVDAHASEYENNWILFSKKFIAIYSRPQALVPGMNSFLKQLEITFRRDPENARPRINKRDSVKVNWMN
jgi:ATP-binding cassette subfamily E protein 1